MHVHDSCCFFATCMRHAVLSDRLMHSRFGTDWDLSIKNLGVLMHFLSLHAAGMKRCSEKELSA